MEVNDNYGGKKKLMQFNHKDKHLKQENWFGQTKSTV